MADAPGPKAWNLFALLPLLARNIPGFQLHLARHYGDIVRFRVGGQYFHLITGANDLATVFHHERKGQYAKGLFGPFMEPVFGRNVFNANGEEWSRRRRVLQPFFTRSYVTCWAEVIYSITEQRLASAGSHERKTAHQWSYAPKWGLWLRRSSRAYSLATMVGRTMRGA